VRQVYLPRLVVAGSAQRKTTPVIANLTSIDCVKMIGNAPAGIVARQRS
jgi:hypothetical protein